MEWLDLVVSSGSVFASLEPDVVTWAINQKDFMQWPQNLHVSLLYPCRLLQGIGQNWFLFWYLRVVLFHWRNHHSRPSRCCCNIFLPVLTFFWHFSRSWFYSRTAFFKVLAAQVCMALARRAGSRMCKEAGTDTWALGPVSLPAALLEQLLFLCLGYL